MINVEIVTSAGKVQLFRGGGGLAQTGTEKERTAMGGFKNGGKSEEPKPKRKHLLKYDNFELLVTCGQLERDQLRGGCREKPQKRVN